MKKILYTTTAFVLFGLAQSQAACITTPSCTSLGYTSTTSCTDGLKCPFGNYWYCPEKTTQENCSNYTYVCSGTGYAGGAGTACNGKYSSCTCANGYEWQNGQCKRNVIWGKCSGYAANCKIGNILFSDGTCNARMVSGKTAIAIVVYISNEGCGQAMALNSLGEYTWGTREDISTLPNLTKTQARYDYASCENSKKLREAGGSPAVARVANYTTTGTKAGDWCLPASGIIIEINSNLRTLNDKFKSVGGTDLNSTPRIWSSSEASKNEGHEAWASDYENQYSLYYIEERKGNSYEVRPVLEF